MVVANRDRRPFIEGHIGGEGNREREREREREKDKMGRQQGPDKGLSQEAMDAMISELQTLCEEAAEERKLTWWLTRDILVKYLRARSWNVKKAHTMLSTSLEWRTKMRPETIRWPEVEDDCRCGKMYRLKCTDLDGRPVILMRPANEEHYGEHDRNIKFLTYILEGIVRSMPHEGDGKMNIIIDFRGWTLRNAPPLKTTKETISILQNQYPERLYKAFLFNPPGIFSIFWSMARPFLDAVTVAKVNFVYAKDKRSTEVRALPV